jgi:acyl carrier protein
MADAWYKIKAMLLEYLFDRGDREITPETRLDDIPDWDSMVAVNVQMLLHETFQVDFPLDLLREETTLGELAALMDHPERIAGVLREFSSRRSGNRPMS